MSKEPWIDALAAKAKVINVLETMPPEELASSTASVERELTNLRIAEVYSFSGTALGAIRQAARTIPGDTVLDSSHCRQGGSGFWWFDDPLPIPRSNFLRDTRIVAVSWNFYVTVSSSDFAKMRMTGIDERASSLVGEKMVKMEMEGDLPFTMEFTAYIDKGWIAPAMTWRWPGQTALEEMVEACSKDGERRGNDTTIAGAIRDLSAFFLAAMTWINQEILELAPLTVRKVTSGASRSEKRRSPRYPVNVIQLRRRHFVHGAEEPAKIGDGPAREWHCQWVVSGHWRNQPYGPARCLRRLVYVNPYVKGPENKPLREARPTVRAVMR